MDNGGVIPGLNESWTLGGAKLNEWIAGFTMFMVASELFFSSTATSMPQLMIIWVSTTFGMASLRRMYPDEERGLRNSVMTALGIEPPGIPAPAPLQPYWSGAPIQQQKPMSEYVQLGIEEALFKFDEEDGSGRDAMKVKR